MMLTGLCYCHGPTQESLGVGENVKDKTGINCKQQGQECPVNHELKL